MNNNFIYKDDLLFIASETKDHLDSVTFFARQQLFQELGIKDKISRFKERSLGLRSSLLVNAESFKKINVLVSNIGDVYKTRINTYIQEIISYNSDFMSLVGGNKQFNIICVGEPSNVGSELTDVFFENYIKENTLHIDRYDVGFSLCISDKILQASHNLNNKKFVKLLLEDFKEDPYPIPMQHVISGKQSYEEIIKFLKDMPNKKYLLKLSVGAFGSHVVEIMKSKEEKIVEIINMHNSILEKGKDSSLLIAEKIEKDDDKSKYISPCVIGRILDENNTFVVQASEQIFSKEEEYVGSYWNKQQELDFFNNVGKERIENFLKYIHNQTGYIGYIGLDFIRSIESKKYYLVGDINARMNGSDDLFFLRRMVKGIFDIDTVIMNDIVDYDLQQLSKYKFNKNINSGLVLLPDIEENIINKNQGVGIFINPSKSELFDEYSSLFL